MSPVFLQDERPSSQWVVTGFCWTMFQWKELSPYRWLLSFSSSYWFKWGLWSEDFPVENWWLRPPASTAGASGSILGQGTKIPLVPKCRQNNNNDNKDYEVTSQLIFSRWASLHMPYAAPICSFWNWMQGVGDMELHMPVDNGTLIFFNPNCNNLIKAIWSLWMYWISSS